jgi:hypothetical protein
VTTATTSFSLGRPVGMLTAVTATTSCGDDTVADYFDPGKGDDRILAKAGTIRSTLLRNMPPFAAARSSRWFSRTGPRREVGAGRDYVVTDMADEESGRRAWRSQGVLHRRQVGDGGFGGRHNTRSRLGMLVAGSIVAFEWIQYWLGTDTRHGSEAPSRSIQRRPGHCQGGWW